MDEWQLYRTIAEYWRARGLHVATSVSDPAGSRVELDVVAFTPELDDVRITEAKVDASGALIQQCVDRFRYASRVYAAVPVPRAEALVEKAQGEPEESLGILAVGPERVDERRRAEPLEALREPGKAHVIERQLRASLAEGEAKPPR